MAKRIKKQIYSFQKLAIELFNIFEYIQTYSLYSKKVSFRIIQIFRYSDIQLFNNSIQLNIFRLIHFIQKKYPLELFRYSDIQIFSYSVIQLFSYSVIQLFSYLIIQYS